MVVYYDIADCIVIMYDITNKSSFNDIENWLSLIKSSNNKRHVLFLLGNKVDLIKDRVMAKKLVLQYAHNKRMHFQEISTLNSSMTNELLERITHYILEKRTGRKTISRKVTPKQEKVCGACHLI